VLCKKGEKYLMKAVDGMWEFPTFSELPEGVFEKIGACRHTITHHRLDVDVYRGKLDQNGWQWTDVEAVPISSLTRKILEVSLTTRP
jgi:hypothetical protein